MQRLRFAVVLLTASTLQAWSLTGCTAEQKTKNTQLRVTVVEQSVVARVGAVIHAGDATVEIPAGALDADGRVRISPPKSESIAGFVPAGAAVHIELQDASLIAPAKVRLRLGTTAQTSGAELVILRSSPESGWSALGADVQGQDLVASTEHFSDFLAVFRELADKAIGNLVPSVDWIVYNSGLVLKRVGPPSCENTSIPRWIVELDRTQGNDSRLRWCAQTGGSELTLKLRNNRPFAQILTFPGLTSISSTSDDPYTLAASGSLRQVTNGKELWVRSGQELDVVFSQPQTGSETQRLTIVPRPDIPGTLAVLLMSEAASKAPNSNAQIFGRWDCITSVRDSLNLPSITDVVPRAVGILEDCLADLSPDLSVFTKMKLPVISFADWNADQNNSGPEIDLVVSASTKTTQTTLAVPPNAPAPQEPTPTPPQSHAPSNNVKPGGLWISPGNDFLLTGDSLHLAAHAYPSRPGDPPIDHVNFTAMWPGGEWRVVCDVSPPSNGDTYECDWSLAGTIPPLTVSFDVYDSAGNRNLAPHGLRRQQA